ncbi:transketolase [Allosaccharopolyspora coralli]|uniref:Transketolase n=1 Tax=Allosaccharopolyspora coralli TaxID=2665642 RepID=A0A5Q3QHA0_9PSEU|nr:transketolase [Allosaccharopolyspora coralli]QGK70839.1 transketolase [Allosaccharopolyspora coralli]
MTTTETPATTMRERFVHTVDRALDDQANLAVVLADISSDRFEQAQARHPDRVLNVGIREQLLVSTAGGLALAGMRPVVHTITPFAVERPFEQLKLDLNHQGVGAVLVSTGGSYDYPFAGRTHMAPGDVALLDTLPHWTIHVPGHADELDPLLRTALSGDGLVYLRMSERQNSEPVATGPGLVRVRSGGTGVVLAVGPMLDPVLEATANLDVSVLYAATVRPFDHRTLRAAAKLAAPDVALVEPYLAGTSAHVVDDALHDLPHRVLSLGVTRDNELRDYGDIEDHDTAHGLTPKQIASSLRAFFR